ncbi:MAG: 50S ribosomal protein L3 [Gammaproteobacteria bacterium]|nr:MAG: 50S ribosomal protein L3 [Gammaproteobacteria bacterium]RKZ76557.1 MAG: 50S ribosomal protein L3 [Gammaproteobacteria bacterium]
MAVGIVGQKRGMTRIFTENGDSIPVSVIEAPPNRVTQLKTVKTEGYHAIQVTCGKRHANRINKPESGHLAKATVEAGRGYWEFRLENEPPTISVGHELKVDIFKNGQKVDVTGVTKGKGFTGTIKRYHFKMQDATHGNSLSHRAAGSIGQNQTPGRVFKGKKMAGQKGHVRCTVQNLEIVRVDAQRHLLLIKGAIPGAPGGDIIIKPAIKMNKYTS